MSADDKYLVVAAITGALGIKGWVKVNSYTEPKSNVLSYKQIFVGRDGQWRAAKCEAGRMHGKGFALKLHGCDDRDRAEEFQHMLIAVEKAALADLGEDEYYWYQLQGLNVFVKQTGQLLGRVSSLLETGSNDVLVVSPCDGSMDQRERLLPYRPEVVLSVDLAASSMQVDWDPEF